MNATKPLLATLSLLLVLDQATTFAQQKQDDNALKAIREKVSSIDSEIKDVQAQLENLETTRVKIVTEEHSLAATADQLRVDRAKLHHDGDALQADALNQNAAGARLEANPPDPRNPAAVAAYKAEAQRLNTWGDRIDEQKKKIMLAADQLIQRDNHLSNATLDNFAQKKKNDTAIEDAQVKRNKLVQKERSLMLDDYFLDDLRKRNLLSKKSVSEMRKKAESMTALDGPLEIAHHLLQEVWDGAAGKH
jgi:hypothetical protein